MPEKNITWHLLPGYVINSRTAALHFTRDVDPVAAPPHPAIANAQRRFEASPEYATYLRAREALIDAEQLVIDTRHLGEQAEADFLDAVKSGGSRPFVSDSVALADCEREAELTRKAFVEAEQAARRALTAANAECRGIIMQEATWLKEKALAEFTEAARPLLDKLLQAVNLARHAATGGYTPLADLPPLPAKPTAPSAAVAGGDDSDPVSLPMREPVLA